MTNKFHEDATAFYAEATKLRQRAADPAEYNNVPKLLERAIWYEQHAADKLQWGDMLDTMRTEDNERAMG